MNIRGQESSLAVKEVLKRRDFYKFTAAVLALVEKRKKHDPFASTSLPGSYFLPLVLNRRLQGGMGLKVLHGTQRESSNLLI